MRPLSLMKGIKKTLKFLAWSAAALAAILLVVLALFLLRPVREKVLDAAVSRGGRSLPGEISISNAEWPSPGTIEFNDIAWTDGGDTLATLAGLRISVDLSELLSRDVHARKLTVRRISADIPAIVARFHSAADSTSLAGKKKYRDGQRDGFPRGGSLIGVPSIAIDRLEIDGGHILAAEGIELDSLRLLCGIDLLHGSEPAVSIDELTTARSSRPVSVDSLWLRADLGEPSVRGEGIIVLPHDLRAALRCDTKPDGSFMIRLVPADGPLTPTDAFVSIEGTAAVENRRPVSVDLEAEFHTPGTRELAALPFLAGSLKGVGDLEGIRGVLEGRLTLSPEFSASADLRLSRNSYLDTLRVTGDYRADTVTVDQIALRMRGLTLDASGSIKKGAPEMSAYIQADSMAWLSRVMPGMTFPERTSAELTIEAGGQHGRDDITFLLTGHARAGGSSIDSIRVSGTVPADRARTFEADMLLDTYGIRIMTSVLGDLSDGILLTLSHQEPAAAETRAVYLAGVISSGRKSRKIVVKNLHIDGMFGGISVSAEIDSSRSGRFDILGDWPVPPAALRSAVAAGSAVWDSISARWISEGPFNMHIGGTVSGRGNRVSAAGSARLPGPDIFSPVLTKGNALEGLGPLALDLEGSWKTTGSGGSVEGRVDLGRTSWIDTALVSVSGSDRSFRADTLLLVFEGLRISAQGGIAGNDLDCDAKVSLADLQLVRRLGLFAGRDLSMALDAACALSGKRNEPSVSIKAAGGMSTEGLAIPAFNGEAERTGGVTEASLHMPEGLIMRAFMFDSVNVSYNDSIRTGGEAGASVTLKAVGKDGEIFLASRLSREGNISVSADTFGAVVSGQTLASKAPFKVSTIERGGFMIERLLLEGSIGSVKADGIVSPDSADMEAHIEIRIPEKPQFIRVAARLWPKSLTADAQADGPSRIVVKGHINGVDIGDGTETVTDFGLTADAGALKSTLTISGPERTVLSLDGTFPPLRSYGSFRDGPMRLDVILDKFPVPGDLKAYLEDKPRQIGSLSGRLSGRGTLSDPEAAILFDFSFIGGNELEKYTLSIDGGYAREALSDTTLRRLVLSRTGEGERSAAEKRTKGLSAGLTLSKSGRPVVTGVFEYPVLITLIPFTFDLTDPGEMLLDLESEELILTDLDPALPPDIDLEGFASFSLKAAGEAGNPRFDGYFKTRNMTLAVASDLSVSPSVDLKFGGDLAIPSVKGDIVIERALLVLPERKESLLEDAGESALWEAADSFRIAHDTLQAGSSMKTREPVETAGKRKMDLDVTITIPNSFRVESKRLNLELEGTLHVRQQGDKPVITGELKPMQGRLVFMGRYFEIQQGSVFFYGGDEMNPSFDLILTARVTEYDININLTGTAVKPQIELTSNPPLSESDIMSLLLFGQVMDSLNGSQSDLLQQRTAEVLMIYGASKLEGEMKKRLGVDMFTFQQSTRDPNKTALALGKYLNSRTMLKYEQGLENTASFLINLEYHLTRRFTIETFIDQATETGLEINWSNEY